MPLKDRVDGKTMCEEVHVKPMRREFVMMLLVSWFNKPQAEFEHLSDDELTDKYLEVRDKLSGSY